MKKLIFIFIGFILIASCVYFYFMQIKEKSKLIAIDKKINSLSEETWKCLNQPKEMVLFSLEPYSRDLELTANDKLFHEFKVLGSLPIQSQSSQAQIANEIKTAVSDVENEFANCFWPRHGLKISDGKTDYDFLICYQCNTLYFYKDNDKKKEIVIGGNVNLLNDILKKANVPLPDTDNSEK